MTQYLLNATAIWLLSLLLFELLLKKEAFHSYNRFYLISTLLLGIFLPLWQWSDNTVISGSGIAGKPINNTIQIKEQVSTSIASQHYIIDWSVYAGYIYLAGVIVSIILLIAAIVKLLTFYYKGKRTKEGAWTVIETGKHHTPFSIFNFVFVESKAQYTAEQWKIILTHEQLHSMAFHFADMLLMQLARIVFWFHPLVYVYQKRLSLVHEYQADGAGAAKAKQYGIFLIEQSMLQHAPVIAHSFNYSPIKSRIIMLSKKSSSITKSKMLLAVPLTLVCLLLFTKSGFSAKFEKQGNIVKYEGNTIELKKGIRDTTVTVNSKTGKNDTAIAVREPYPIKLNGEKIFTMYDSNIKMKYHESAEFVSSKYAESILEYLLNNLTKEVEKLDDGGYRLGINNVVLDQKGKIVYYEYSGVVTASDTIPDEKLPKANKAVSDEVGRKIGSLLNNYPARNPAHLNGTGVPFLLYYAPEFLNIFTVKNHKLVSI
jgi:hypothetical protein